ncbi:MAG: HD domain-containing protein [Bdellovibrionaceae bacterium]|nr:HD domain-containing protein [Pseudobdellovibrionaceae bacterium]
MDYTSIRVSTLRGDQKIGFNVFLKIGEKWILYLREGDSFEGDRLKRLKEKKLKKMFIKTEDEEKYRNYIQQNIDMAFDDKSGRDIKTRAEVVQGIQQSNVEEVFEKPENEMAYNIARDSAGKYVQFILNNKQAFPAVMAIENLDRSLSQHCVTVSTMAIALAQRENITDQKSLQLLTLGALLHDLGHRDASYEIARPLESFTAEDMKLYMNHPKIGAQLAQDKKHFDQLVINIIAQHEECLDGSGFPQGLKANSMDPSVLIVATCNQFDRLMSFEGVGRDQVAKKIMLDKVGRYPLPYLQKLSEILRGI